MHKISCYISALGAIVVAVVGVTACGGGSSEIVAQVGTSSISRATLDHWIPIEAIVSYELFPRKPVPRGLVPDPPNYTACIAYLESTPQKLVERGPKPTTAQLKSQCQQKYEGLRRQVLNFLITAEWMIGEGAERGVKVTDEEVRQQFEGVKKTFFPKEAEFEKFIAITGETVPDQLFRSKVQLLEHKLFAKKGLTAKQQQAYLKFVNESTKKWIARTSCRAGYVVPDCKEYKGPLTPGA